jgi:hypothetical protein
MNTSRTIILVAALASAGALACSTPKPEPEIASSAGQSGYARNYPTELQTISKDFDERETEAKDMSQKFSGYPAELKNPEWNRVLEIVTTADDAGRSSAYVDRLRDTEGARAFFKEHKDEIVKKVAGSAQYVAKQKGCDVDVAGAAAHALDESVDKELQKHLDDRNEAQLLIDRYEPTLGKENVPVLEKQADTISRASYLVHIELVESKVRIDALLLEAEQIQKTLDDSIAAERSAQNGKLSAAEKKASDDRIAAATAAKGLMESALTQGKALKERVAERITAAQKNHTDAMTSLKNDISAKAGGPSAPAAAPAASQ